jgi:hypothetical protein
MIELCEISMPFAMTPGVGCGAAASGHYVWNDPTDIAKLLTCMVMSGPFLTGYTQVQLAWSYQDPPHRT